MNDSKIRLTQFSPGAGCGCKISPKDLEEILKGTRSTMQFANLLVGNESKDDAAVYDIGGGKSVISTTDFFMPIVDDPYDFGRIAATNAISDIYAMGGTPLMAISILGWPLEKLSSSIARDVINGGRSVCDLAGIPLAGGHSINSEEPIFGLAVTGLIDSKKVKKNNSAIEGSLLFITKPLGIGLVASAEKFGVVRAEDKEEALRLMTTLNSAGMMLSNMNGVCAMTDITGFGLAGHTVEMAEGSGLTAVVRFSSLPKISGVQYYIDQECMPGGTFRNFSSYGDKTNITPLTLPLVCDPQTSGGLLIAVEPYAVREVVKEMKNIGQPLFEIGYLKGRGERDLFLEII